jgi:outer dense fiber protein 2
MSNLRLEYTQLKREKDELERRFTSQLRDLRDKLHQSNNTNRAMQNYVNSLKTTYASLFNDTIPASLTRYTTT